MVQYKKIWVISLSLFAGWYWLDPFFLPSRYPVETTAGGQTLPSAILWSEWLFSPDRTGQELRRWVIYAHPGLFPTYAILGLIVAGSPWAPRLFYTGREAWLEYLYKKRRGRILQEKSQPSFQDPGLCVRDPQVSVKYASETSDEAPADPKGTLPKLPPVYVPDLTVGGVRIRSCAVKAENPFGAATVLEDRWASSTEAERAVPNFIKIIQARSDSFLGIPPAQPAAVMALIEEFPNFEEVLNFIAGYCAAGKVGSLGRMFFPPILLLGPPGIGKTELCSRLGDVLHTPVENIGLGGNSGGAMILGGMNSGWRGSSPGHVALVLALTGVVNPLFLLDEIDKVPVDAASVSSVTSYLLPALEKTSAKKLMDEFLGPQVPFDASKILWVAAANTLATVPSPLIERFQVFQIKNIPEDKMPPVILAITKKIVSDLGLTDIARVSIDETALASLVKYPPRSIRKLVQKTVLDVVRVEAHVGSPQKISIHITADVLAPFEKALLEQTSKSESVC